MGVADNKPGLAPDNVGVSQFLNGYLQHHRHLTSFPEILAAGPRQPVLTGEARCYIYDERGTVGSTTSASFWALFARFLHDVFSTLIKEEVGCDGRCTNSFSPLRPLMRKTSSWIWSAQMRIWGATTSRMILRRLQLKKFGMLAHSQRHCSDGEASGIAVFLRWYREAK